VNEWVNERVMNNIFEIIIKIENNNTNEMSDVMMIKFEILWMSSEQYWIVNQILIIEHVYALFKKALTCEMIISRG